jgi:hypothetical protein
MAAPKVKYLKKTVQQVMEDAREQIHHPTGPKPGGRWDGRCQQFCRTMYGIPAWGGTAAICWSKIPPQFRHTHGGPSSAPRGALLYFVNRSGRGAGHVMIAAGVRTHNKAIGTDYQRQGKVDFCPRGIPNWGNLKYVGWSAYTPFGFLRVDD